MEPLEIEVKFYIDDVNSLRRAISALGADDQGEAFESNIRYEDAENRLIQNKSLLRLRQDKKAILTYKSNVPGHDTEYKIRRELEVTVSDFKTMDAILTALGFHQAQVYEKKRQTYKIGETTLCLDAMPFGDFLEIEGQKQDIRRIADQLNLDWGCRILTNYLRIFDIIRQDLGLGFTDVTFDNFRSVAPIDMMRYMPIVQVGG